MELKDIFDQDARSYDRYRPGYPDALFEDIISYSGIRAGSALLEIGPGTGQATVPFLKAGGHVTAVEPGAHLCQYLEEKCRDFPGFRAVRADFMEYEVREQSMDLVYSATAFHWLPEKEAYEKVFRCLKKGGTAALFWNHPFPNREEDKSNRASREVYEKFRPSGGKQVEFSEADCEATVRRMEQYGFIHVESRLYRRVRTLETEAYIGLLNTYSDHLSMEPRMKEAFEEEMRRAVNEAGGRISIYDTIDLYLGKRPE